MHTATFLHVFIWITEGHGYVDGTKSAHVYPRQMYQHTGQKFDKTCNSCGNAQVSDLEAESPEQIEPGCDYDPNKWKADCGSGSWPDVSYDPTKPYPESMKKMPRIRTKESICSAGQGIYNSDKTKPLSPRNQGGQISGKEWNFFRSLLKTGPVYYPKDHENGFKPGEILHVPHKWIANHGGWVSWWINGGNDCTTQECFQTPLEWAECPASLGVPKFTGETKDTYLRKITDEGNDAGMSHCVKLPANFKNNRYQLLWRWDVNGGTIQMWMNCFDICINNGEGGKDVCDVPSRWSNDNPGKIEDNRPETNDTASSSKPPAAPPSKKQSNLVAPPPQTESNSVAPPPPQSESNPVAPPPPPPQSESNPVGPPPPQAESKSVAPPSQTEQPQATPAPQPQSAPKSSASMKCWLKDCGCPPNHKHKWCKAETGVVQGNWCNQDSGKCQNCNGVWCGNEILLNSSEDF